MACILLLRSAVRVYDSQAYRKMDVTRNKLLPLLLLLCQEHDNDKQYAQLTTEDYIRAENKLQFISLLFVKQIIN